MDSGFTPTEIPLNILETGWDILGFWVVRMIGMTMLLTNQVPFSMVVLHGLIRDQSGRKMRLFNLFILTMNKILVKA